MPCGAFEHLDPVEVERAHRLTVEQLYVVAVEADAGAVRAAERAHPSQHHVGSLVGAGGDVHVGDDVADIVEPGDVRVGELGRADRGDGRRDLLDRLRLLARGDNHLVDLRSVGLRVRRRDLCLGGGRQSSERGPSEERSSALAAAA